jgi:pimeloyl-ACP methyl ester carboxylesterase
METSVQSLPVQIIAAEDDRGFTKREIVSLGNLYPRSQTLTLPTGTGHLSFLTRPREYVEAVRELVAGVMNRWPSGIAFLPTPE